MNYRGCVNSAETSLSIEREGLRLGSRFLDFADLKALRPVSHRVLIDTLQGQCLEISMLGFSYDGFWEELLCAFSARSLEALFTEGAPLMNCEGEYETPQEWGRGKLALFSDAVCILPQTANAVRIPLCFTSELRLDGYMLRLTTQTGAQYAVGRMGYDTKPFAERAMQAAENVKRQRQKLLAGLAPQAPFPHAGLFRTSQPELHWQAALADGACAVELFTGDDAATYLYRFSEPLQVFLPRLEEAMEAMGPHREIIFLTDAQLNEKPLYRMALHRSAAVGFLRQRSAGRLIHNASHGARLAEFLSCK